VIVEMCGKTSRVEAFLSLVKPFGVLESARTGMFFFPFIFSSVLLTGTFDKIGVMAMPRTPIASYIEDDGVAADEGGPVDASLLPPG
jgi:acetolactate synthase I/III small subunit